MSSVWWSVHIEEVEEVVVGVVLFEGGGGGNTMSDCSHSTQFNKEHSERSWVAGGGGVAGPVTPSRCP